jgi:hypothetical protein
VYTDPNASFKFYTLILMDPVMLYASKEHSMLNVSTDDQKKLLNYSDASIRDHLARD